MHARTQRGVLAIEKKRKEKETLPLGTTRMDLEGIMLNDFTYLKTLKKEKKKTNGQTKDKNKSYRCRKKQAFARGESGGRRREVRETKMHKLLAAK